jgi:hypothetical protein
VLTVLALAAALGGLLIDGVYTGADSAAAMFRGYDLVTVIAVVPSLVVGLWLARRGSFWGQLVAASMIASLVYTYAYYLFGTGFNDLFLLHVAVFGACLIALVLNIASIDVADVTARFEHGTHVRIIAGILGMLAIGLAAMWVYFAFENAVTGDVPPGSQLVETDTIVHLGMALDLTVLVPLYAAAAVLLWRRAAWGFVLAAVALFAGVLHQVSYIVAMPFQVAADVAGAKSYDPGEPAMVLLYLVAAVLLVRGANRAVSTRCDP